VKGKVIGACCLGEIVPPQARSAQHVGGMTAVGAFVLAGLAGATLWLDWRLSEVETGLGRRVASVNSGVSGQRELWTDVQKQFDHIMPKEGLAPVVTQLTALDERLGRTATELVGRLDGAATRFAGLEEVQQRLVAGQAAIQAEVQGLGSRVVGLEQELAAAVAAARVEAAPPRVDASAPRPAPEVPSGVAGLPAELQHHAALLKGEDAGDRFEAVDQLIQSRHAAARELLVPMLKDPDLFVRRLTAEGLGEFKDASSVDALLVALADPEGIVRQTAYASLKKLTGQSIAFDPEGSSGARSQAQRKWKDWWEKNQDAF
jgi:hypothetical protein